MATMWNENPLSPPTIQECSDQQSVHVRVELTTPKKSSSNIPPFDVAAKDIKSRIPALSVHVNLKQGLFISNGNVNGQLQLKCDKECKIGRIIVHLIGIEGKLA